VIMALHTTRQTWPDSKKCYNVQEELDEWIIYISGAAELVPADVSHHGPAVLDPLLANLAEVRLSACSCTEYTILGRNDCQIHHIAVNVYNADISRACVHKSLNMWPGMQHTSHT